MFKELLEYAKKPALFEKGTANFWDAPHISKHLLAAHLDPNWHAASRRPAAINETVAWINDKYLRPGAMVLDIGCGPGLYAERLARLGHNVTGIDFSQRSIDHAQRSAEAQGLSISYRYQNYLEIEDQGQFDLVMLIYCDFGALIDADRDLLLKRVHRALKPGGVFIFDVFTEEFSTTTKEKKSWQLTDDGFWAEGVHCVLVQNFHYPEEKVLLNQNIVMREDGTHDVYRIYDHHYSDDDLAKVLDESGFRGHRFFYDIIGDINHDSERVVFVAAQK